MLQTIEFNKNYTKLPDRIKTAVLVACEPVRLLDLAEKFIQYDTEFRVPMGYQYGKLYSDYLRKYNDDLLCLILKSDSGAIFITLRKDNFENRAKYMCQFVKDEWTPIYNKQFQIIIKEG